MMQDVLTIIGIALTLLTLIVGFLWTEIKDQRARVDAIQKEAATQTQLIEVERRIMDSLGKRMEGIENKLDMLISHFLKD
jgi:predicted Holliday junction resolvase-like endonuclease